MEKKKKKRREMEETHELEIPGIQYYDCIFMVIFICIL